MGTAADDAGALASPVGVGQHDPAGEDDIEVGQVCARILEDPAT